MSQDNFEISVLSVKSFVFALPGMGELLIDVSVNYFTDKDGNIVSEAWLHPENQKAMMFLADVCSFADSGQTDDEIEDRLLDYYSASETFQESVSALLSGNSDYFAKAENEER